jgi:hypothetical protein
VLRVTGKTYDFWLVRTVGGLAAAIGGSLVSSAARGRKRETSLVALTSGIVFGMADVRAARSHSPLHLDLLLQVALAPTWVRSWESGSTPPSRSTGPD